MPSADTRKRAISMKSLMIGQGKPSPSKRSSRAVNGNSRSSKSSLGWNSSGRPTETSFASGTTVPGDLFVVPDEFSDHEDHSFDPYLERLNDSRYRRRQLHEEDENFLTTREGVTPNFLGGSQNSSSDSGEGKTFGTKDTQPDSYLEHEEPSCQVEVPTKTNTVRSSVLQSTSLGLGSFSLKSLSLKSVKSPLDEHQESLEDSTSQMKSNEVLVKDGRQSSSRCGPPVDIPKDLAVNLQASAPQSPDCSIQNVTEDRRENLRSLRQNLRSHREYNHWNDVVRKQIASYGMYHSKTAEGLLHLGTAYMQLQEYTQAVVTFQSACKIWKKLPKTNDSRLAMARVVDHIGMAWIRIDKADDKDHYHKAMRALEEVFRIRYDILGAWHVDTVETLNKIASVQMFLGQHSSACRSYWEVYCVRRAIFGDEHPSVAVAAHSLGNMFIKLSNLEEAARYYAIAMDIYNTMGLSDGHPAVIRLLRDQNRSRRLSQGLQD